MLEPLTIQRALADARIYRGALDGQFGPISRAARDAALTKAKIVIDAWPHSRRMVAISQWVLQRNKLYDGPIDGLEGPATRAAEYAFRRPKASLPWMEEAEKALGLHEIMDHDTLAAFLRSDGRTSGDPAKVPWCGDFVSTCLARALPKEPQPSNPFAARNWSDWGEDAQGRFGAVISFWRGSRGGWQGHVGFAVAYDPSRGFVQVLGGNQGNEVSRAWLSTDRILAWRAPKGWVSKMPLIGARSSGGAAISTNEA